MAQKLNKKHINYLIDLLKKYEVSWVGIYLFGSVAKGFATQHSDIDLCIVIKDATTCDAPKQAKIMGEAGRALYPFDLVFVTAEEYRNNLDSPILHEIRKSSKKVA